jgi:hypothetical protein
MLIMNMLIFVGLSLRTSVWLTVVSLLVDAPVCKRSV